MKKKGHRMKNILPESIASELGLESGDVLLAINGQEITDVFDYQYAVMDERIQVLIEKRADG